MKRIDREQRQRIVYVIVYYLILFFSFLYSISSIIWGVTLRVAALNGIFFIVLAAIMFSLIYWQFPNFVNDKVEEKIYYLKRANRDTKRTVRDSKHRRRAKSKKMQSRSQKLQIKDDKNESLPNSHDLTLKKQGSKEKILGKIKYFFLGTKVIKASWMNILFIIGGFLITNLTFFSLLAIFSIKYTIIWAIVNIVYSLAISVIILIPLRIYIRLLVEELVKDR
jgi:hypothetical protein